MTHTRLQFHFNTQDALTLGLDAAILWALIQDLAALSEDGISVSVNESRWLDWLPFFTPAQFMRALEVLSDTGKVIRQPAAHEGMITLCLRAGQPTRSDSANRHSEPDLPDQESGRREQALRNDADTAEFDMPPPMPVMSPLLTDNTLMMDQHATTRRRYVDEPLYQMENSATPDSGMGADQSDVEADGTTESGRRQSTRMTLDWQPSEDCLNLVQNKGISSDFAMAQRESFVLYYRDSGQRQLSWDTKFFNWVCRRWQYHLNDQNHDLQANANNPADARSRKQKLRAKLRDIGDLDW